MLQAISESDMLLHANTATPPGSRIMITCYWIHNSYWASHNSQNQRIILFWWMEYIPSYHLNGLLYMQVYKDDKNTYPLNAVYIIIWITALQYKCWKSVGHVGHLVLQPVWRCYIKYVWHQSMYLVSRGRYKVWFTLTAM